MHTKVDLMNHLSGIGIKPNDTLLVHSSMKAIGSVDGGAETVLDALIEYLKDGLLIFPTHTWAQMNENYSVFNPLTEPSCVGLLTNLFLKRPEAIRSWHPTHSVAAIGKDAQVYTQGEEQFNTPCARLGCWGKLYDREAKILFLGCGLKKNTIIHGVEEWNHIPQRLADKCQDLSILVPDGCMIACPQYRHYHPHCNDISAHYDKLEAPLLHLGIAKQGRIGDSLSIL